MKLKTKLFLGLGGTLLLSTPLIALASCSEAPASESYLNLAMNNVKKNLLNETAARWVLPSSLTNIQTVTNHNKFTAFSNYGYAVNVVLSSKQDEKQDEKGTVNVDVTLSNGRETKKETITLSGFLTTLQQTNNTELGTTLSDLQISNGILNPTIFATITNKELSNNINKPINELIQLDSGSGQKLEAVKSNLIEGFDRQGKVLKKLDIEFPIIQQELQVSKDGKTSSKFQVQISGFTRNLVVEDIQKLINVGGFTKQEFAQKTPDEITKLSESELGGLFATNFSDSSLTSFESSSFQNVDKINIKPIKVNSVNKMANSANITFEIVMDKEKPTEKTMFTTNVFGLKYEAKTIAPTALKQESYIAKEAVDSND